MPGAWWPGRRERVVRELGDYNVRPCLGIADGRTEETAVIELLVSYQLLQDGVSVLFRKGLCIYSLAGNLGVRL